MNALLRALAAERIKLRHTLAAGMVVLAPSVVLVLTVLQLSLSTMHGRPAGSGGEAWLHFASGLFVLWSFLMLPLFVTLQAALLGNMEHANHTWKHLLALPLPRWSHYAAKLCVLAAMVMLSTALLAGLAPLAGWVVMHTQPAYGLAGPPPHLAVNTAVSFTTNTNWQSYAGESTMSNLSQMLGLTIHNFMSAATGIALVNTVRTVSSGRDALYW